MTSSRLHDIVKAYDVRGRVPDQLDAGVARALGAAFAQVVVAPERLPGVAVGRDVRASSPELAAAFAEGVAEQGVDVVALGPCSTDQLYFASGRMGLAGAMVTASHNPPQDNGLKLCRDRARPVGQDSGLAEVRDLAQWLLDRGSLHALPRPSRVGDVRTEDVLGDYADHLHSLVDLDGGRPLRVVVDAGSGMAGLTAPAVLDCPGLGVELVPLYFDLDGSFPHHLANPLLPATLADLCRTVRETRADLGLAFDGDADRCVVVDERGEVVPPAVVAALVADREVRRAVAAGTPAEQVAVVHNSITSRIVPDTVRAAGARPVRCRVGHSFVKACMAEHDAVFGGEHSAHYYFRDFWFADSGMLAALHVLSALAGQAGPMSALVDRYGRYVASGEINTAVPVAEVPAALERVRAWGRQQGAEAEELDGVILVHEQHPWWWLSLRPSNTESLLRLNVEGHEAGTVDRVRDEVLALVRR
ncbi:phosphohexomutase domain-containing protein [Ornithinicoccus halotolerans]|uniref:phosphomannomutase/phosphoglucomutase n=1 Tax=Ornithinicoccus halotolerans TaxID=1748220 RepID=UPI00129693D2|nr:phosphomannomutase/phosphoglucomutase [Ornithinicoccus halotolerans]